MIPSVPVKLSGERFRVAYQLAGTPAEAEAKARDICLEQTVEFPDDLVPSGDIRDHVLGRIESLERVDEQHSRAIISFAIEISGFELVQLLNAIFGNISMKPGIRAEYLDLPPALLEAFRGPRFGRAGLRRVLDAPSRPLICTALKPMGLGPAELAELAYQFALGGIDIIKDDHGLADQSFCRYEERVISCARAVDKANRETGFRCVYAPNVSAPADQIVGKALFAREQGAGALLVAPGLVGLDAMRELADDDRIGLPILSHPAFGGSFVMSPEQGISHFVLYGQISRLAGADAVIYPNYGGRFSFTREDCRSIAQGTETPMADLAPIFPTPAGGMSLDRVRDMLEDYGREVVFLIGGGLHKRGPDLVANCRYFRDLVEQM